MTKGFRDFILRGNVVDLAVAVVLGAAFGAVIAAVVRDLITPLIGIPGSADFGNLTFSINGSVFRYGDVINQIITFLLIAAAVYFVVVVPMNRVLAMRAKPATEKTTRECPECLSDVPRAARRCAFCTAQIPLS